MKRAMSLILTIMLAFLLRQGVALSMDEITWDEISEADVVIMPEQLLDHEIASCASIGDMENCIYLAEMFDITNAEWYVVDAIPQGWQMDALNRTWRRKPADEIEVRGAWQYVPRIVNAYIEVIETLERDGYDHYPVGMPSPYDLVYRVTGQSFDNSRDLKRWVQRAKVNLAGVTAE